MRCPPMAVGPDVLIMPKRMSEAAAFEV